MFLQAADSLGALPPVKYDWDMQLTKGVQASLHEGLIVGHLGPHHYSHCSCHNPLHLLQLC